MGRMTDALQQSLHTAAANNSALTTLAVIAANDLIVLMAFGLAALLFIYRYRLTRAFLLRVALSGLVALVLVQVLGHTVHDPRPYMAEHYDPLAHASSDNGFPSDHTLFVSLFTGWLMWLLPASNRAAWLTAFALGAVAVALGRLAIGAHHTLDVLGSVLIAAGSLGLASLPRLGAPWQTPVLKPTPQNAR